MATLTQWISAWIDRRSIRLAPQTISGYRRLLRKYVETSTAGALQIGEIKPEDLICMLSPIVGSGHTRAAQLVQVLVGAALRDACRQRVIGWNPMECVDKIRHHRERTAWLTTEQARRLLEANRDEPFYVAWLLMLCCGLRRGEMLGLMWDDVDFAGQVLRIRRQRIRVDGKIIETRPKSDASIRDIPLDEILIDELRRFRAGRYVLEAAGAPVTDKTLQRALEAAIGRADVPRVTLHGLRHTMASTAASRGVPIKILQAIMGHAQYSTTADVYAHVDRREVCSAAKVIAFSTFGARLEIA